MKFIRAQWLVLTAALLFSACVKEDEAACGPDTSPDPVQLSFVYYGDGTQDMFASRIGRVSLYVFSATGNFLDRYDIPSESLDRYPGYRLELPAGQYELVCWGNAAGNSSVAAGATKNDFWLYHPDERTEAEIQTFDPLYYAKVHLDIKEGESRSVVVPFLSAHIDLEVHIGGLHHIRSDRSEAEHYRLEFTDLPARYDFDRLVDHRRIPIFPELSVNQPKERLVAAFSSLRFGNTPETVMNFYRNGEFVLALSLAEFMKRFAITVEERQEVRITIYIRFLLGGVIEIGTEAWDNSIVVPDI